MAILLLISPLLSPLSLAGDSDDAVNERIPVNRAEMEAHWQVDCAAAWEQLLAAAAQSTKQPINTNNCGIPDQLRREIQLCAFIYQAPGGNSGHDCPDYRGVSEYLDDADKSSKCPASILQMLGCKTPIQ
jgi:hypothetical protein